MSNKISDNFMRVPNTRDNLHCLQACLRMVYQMCTGELIDMSVAEEATGCQDGIETWPYTAIAWLAERGYIISHIDSVDPLEMCNAPRRTLSALGLPGPTVDYFIEITDFDLERRAIERSIATGRVDYKVRKPTLEDINGGLMAGCTPMISLDLGVLNGSIKQEFRLS